jgi:hypothetical protein
LTVLIPLIVAELDLSLEAGVSISEGVPFGFSGYEFGHHVLIELLSICSKQARKKRFLLKFG